MPGPRLSDRLEFSERSPGVCGANVAAITSGEFEPVRQLQTLSCWSARCFVPAAISVARQVSDMTRRRSRGCGKGEAFFAFHFSMPLGSFGQPCSGRWRSVAQRRVWPDGVVFPLAKATSICRSILTTCSGVVFFPRAMLSSFSASFSHPNWYRKGRALHVFICFSATRRRLPRGTAWKARCLGA